MELLDSKTPPTNLPEAFFEISNPVPNTGTASGRQLQLELSEKTRLVLSHMRIVRSTCLGLASPLSWQTMDALRRTAVGFIAGKV
mmetsp:Transcript_69462/g.137356  ORF Transcript_69462/g.137356 Transcript_69462/m.137356 type:complete len:85 (-) Transcript_69462:34-288(-)